MWVDARETEIIDGILENQKQEGNKERKFRWRREPSRSRLKSAEESF